MEANYSPMLVCFIYVRLFEQLVLTALVVELNEWIITLNPVPEVVGVTSTL